MGNISFLFDLSLIQIRYVSNWFYIGHRYSAKNSPNQGCRLKYGLSWNKMLTVGALCSLLKISLGDLKNISSKFASVTNVCLSEPLKIFEKLKKIEIFKLFEIFKIFSPSLPQWQMFV